MGELLSPFPGSIQSLLPLWPGLPPPVHPEPLVGIATDVIFNHFREQSGVGDYVGFAVGGADQLYGGIETKAIFLQAWVPDGEAGDDGGVSFQSYARDAARGAGLDAEEV